MHEMGAEETSLTGSLNLIFAKHFNQKVPFLTRCIPILSINIIKEILDAVLMGANILTVTISDLVLMSKSNLPCKTFIGCGGVTMIRPPPEPLATT
jgi:hypothetical protein